MDENGRLEQMPQNIGRYQIQGSIGYGAMGAVYKAFDPLIKRTLAIKTIRLDIPRQSPQYKSFIDRFYHEARISGTLSHPNIVTLFDIGEESGLPYLAMELVEGETIASILEKGNRFKPERVINLVSQVASAVDYAHSKGVIHRDIKPSNLILYEGEKVKVTDFGIAKLVDAELTQAGTLLGTPSYMSPEQAMGDKLDGRSDIFSLGVCAFEMLSGEQPFPGNNVTSILYKLVHVEPVEPANLEMHGLVPQKWHEVFSKVLSKKPDERYQTATEFVQDLEYCLGSWFGAVPDVTLVEAPVPETRPMSPPPAAVKTGARPAPAPAYEEATAKIPGPAKPEVRAAVPPSFPGPDEIEMTVAMVTPDLGEEVGAKEGEPSTLVPFSQGEGASPPEVEGTVLLPAPAAVPPPLPHTEMEGTVLLPAPASSAPAVAPSPPPEIEGTMLMAVPTMPTVAPVAPPPQAEIEGTMLMAVPALPAEPPTPPAPEVEGTMLMAAPALPAEPPWPPAPEVEGTMLMAVPAHPVEPPSPPAPEVEGTMLMAVPALPAEPPWPPAPEVEGTMLMAAPRLAAAPPAVPSPPEVEGTMLMQPPRVAAGVAPRPFPHADVEGTVLMPSPAPSAQAATAPRVPKTAEVSQEEAAGPAPRKGIPVTLIAGVGGLVVLLGAAVVGLRLWKGREVAPTPLPPTPTPVVSVAPTPEPTPVIVKGSVRVDSQPAGAAVSVDEQARGTAPVDVADLAMGEHEVKVELKGYAATTQKVVLTPEAPSAEVKLTLSRTAPPMGMVEFRSVPEGGLVRIDGVAVGQTPLLNHRLKVGDHTIEITAEGFEPWSGTVTVKEGRRAKLDALMKAIPKPTPTPEIKVDVVDPNKVHLPSEVDTPPKKVSGTSAAYPKGAPPLKSGEAVSVAVEYVVTPSGDVSEVKVIQSGGQVIDDAVVAAVSKWKYTAGVRKGIKVKVRVTFKQTFKAG